jgi:nicotinamide-nucleotide amidase
MTSEEKRVGLVWVAVSDADGTDAVEKRFNRDRNRIRFYASQQALDLVRRCLM